MVSARRRCGAPQPFDVEHEAWGLSHLNYRLAKHIDATIQSGTSWLYGASIKPISRRLPHSQ